MLSLFPSSLFGVNKVHGYRVLKASPESIDLEVDYELDPTDGNVYLQVQGILPESDSSMGYFGFTPHMLRTGRNKTPTTLSINGPAAPAAFTTSALEFSFYQSQNNPYILFRFPYKKRWTKKVIPGGTQKGEIIGDFHLTDAEGRDRSFRQLARRRPVFLYCINPVVFEREIANLEPLMKELESEKYVIIGFKAYGGTKSDPVHQQPSKAFGTILMDPTNLACQTYRLGSYQGMVVGPSGKILYQGTVANEGENLLWALGVGVRAWPYQPEKSGQQ